MTSVVVESRRHGRQVILVDDKYADLASRFYVGKTTGAHTLYAMRAGKPSNVYLHREILRLEGHDLKRMVVDHVNGNGLDNRMSNLRICTHAENTRNCRKKQGTSRFKGVVWHKPSSKWLAHCRIGKSFTHLGLFEREEDAAAAYDMAAVKSFGEFARTNASMGLL